LIEFNLLFLLYSVIRFSGI